MINKFKEILFEKIETLPNIEEKKKYFKRHKVRVLREGKKETELFVDNETEVSIADWHWVVLDECDGRYIYVVLSEFLKKCLILGGLP